MKNSLASHLPRRRGRGQAGQTMVLGALLLIVVVFSMLMTFNIGNAVHERIRIQQAVDAKAYSTAVIQARAFNFFAYTNRAIAASYVAMTTAHAYHSATTLVASMYFATFLSLMANSAAEVGHACSCQPYCCNILGWVHVGQVLAAAFSFLGRMSGRINQLKDLESPFRNWMQALEAMPPYYSMFQRGIKLWTGDVLSVGLTGTLNSLTDANAKGMPNSAALLMAENGKYFLDGNPFAVFSSNDSDKRSIMKEIANGSRWGGSPEDGRCNFIANRNSGNICAVANLALYLPAMQKIWDAIPICSGSPEMMLTPAFTHGATVLRNNGGDGWGVDSGGSSTRIRKAQTRNSVSSSDFLVPLGVFTVCIHFPWIGVSPLWGEAHLRSDETGSGKHSFDFGLGGSPHSGNHRWGGIKTDFMEFKPKSEPAENIGNATLEPAIDNQRDRKSVV